MKIIQKLLFVFVILAIIGLGGVGYFYYGQYQQTQKELQALKDDLSAVKRAVQAETKKIEEDPVNAGLASSSASLDSSRKTEVKVVLLNGTSKVGLTKTMESEIEKVSDRINVIKKDNAESSNYDKTLIVVVNGLAKEVADVLAKDLKAKVSSLPAGEIKPKDADLLVILGKDQV